MFNVAVLKLKDITKYFLCIIITIVCIFAITNFFKNTKNSNQVKSVFKYDLINCIDSESSVIKEINKKDENLEQSKKSDFFESILENQIGSIEDLENTDKEVNVQEENNSEGEKDNIELAQTNQKTEVITNNPIAENSNVQYGKVKIKNQTTYNLTEEMLKPDIKIENKNIILFSTHTCESYTSSDKFKYTPTGTFRTTDLNFTVARVADEFESQLKQYNYNVIHDKTYHDYPAYNGSYARSLETVENILKNTPADIIFDVHRDAIGSRSDYAPIVKIGDNDIAAQIMFVIGTNERWTLASELESEFKICNKSSRKGRRIVSRFVQTNNSYKI